MAKFMTFTEAEAKTLMKECPEKLIEIDPGSIGAAFALREQAVAHAASL